MSSNKFPNSFDEAMEEAMKYDYDPDLSDSDTDSVLVVDNHKGADGIDSTSEKSMNNFKAVALMPTSIPHFIVEEAMIDDEKSPDHPFPLAFVEATLKAVIEDPDDIDEDLLCPEVVCSNIAMGLSDLTLKCSGHALDKFKVPGAKDKRWYFVAAFNKGTMFNIIRINHPKDGRMGVVHYYGKLAWTEEGTRQIIQGIDPRSHFRQRGSRRICPERVSIGS